jgi:CheY-like chemotaxis protein
MNLLVLVVDDEPDVEALFRQQFRREMRAGRFVMDFSSSGAQAIERIRQAEEDSLILLFSDINMPGMSGLELLPRVKEMLPDLPVIMITAYGDAATVRRAKEAGAHDVYDKPIDFAALKVEIDQRLAARGLPA